MHRRKRLQEFLLNRIDLLKRARSDDEELLATLQEAVRGLENLDYGQIDEIFSLPKWAHGRQPANVRRYQAHAVGHVFSLHKKTGLTVADAEETVAKAYGITSDALRQWKTKLKNSPDPVLIEIVQSYKTTVIFPTDPAKILTEIERKGQLYRNALKPKKGKKIT